MNTNTFLLAGAALGICFVAAEIHRANELKALELEQARKSQTKQIAANFAGGFVGSLVTAVAA